eukprot:CAMPEP_0118660690 /NCGR_PEP_ID=MMETSP0785-20121206/15832_1 /TAXON_ID=91992 /ORGANISM="Bolidomonas pacifica, Strain CCMP 1866" /LENGTH=95 /DNA_ID=CAMNT_0006553983 /DNA_START=78 /DNA_END=362 /DNA_ORIENTATION=-
MSLAPPPHLLSKKMTKTLTLDDVVDNVEMFLPNVVDEELRVKLEAVRDAVNISSNTAASGGGGGGEISLADLINGNAGEGVDDNTGTSDEERGGG